MYTRIPGIAKAENDKEGIGMKVIEHRIARKGGMYRVWREVQFTKSEWMVIVMVAMFLALIATVSDSTGNVSGNLEVIFLLSYVLLFGFIILIWFFLEGAAVLWAMMTDNITRSDH
jgi:hypothetical protein